MRTGDFELLFDQAPIATAVLSPEFAIVGANQAYLRATTARREDIVGRPIWEAFPGDPSDHDATDVAALAAMLRRVVDRREPVREPALRYPLRRETAQGVVFEPHYWRLTSSPVLDARGELAYVLQQLEDVTESIQPQRDSHVRERPADEPRSARSGAPSEPTSEPRTSVGGTIQRLEASTRLLSDRLASAVESIQDAFALFDAENRLIMCNSTYRSLFQNVLPGPLVGRSFFELFDAWTREMDFPDEEERLRFRDARVNRLHEPTRSFEVRLRDGRRMRVSDRRTAEGGMVKTIWDLSEEERRAEELRDARATAEAASAAKSEFLASMSHELRTPLNAILGFAQLLQLDGRDPLSERHRERVGHIVSGGEHLLRLIDDVLDLARIEAGRIAVSIEPVELNSVLEEVRKTLDAIAARQGIALVLVPFDSARSMILADRTRFSQILMNLGSNAIKYNRIAGRVTFTVTFSDPGRVRVTVTDTGLGIPWDKQDKLFQPFQRAGQETGPIEGTGIGLVITRQLARMMGGDVNFRSAPNEGSAFWVDIPSASTEQRVVAPPRKSQPALRSCDGDGKRLVLYVEDNPANLTFMRDLMDTFQHVELTTVATAELGIEFARARKPHVILMDINLPGMSGVDALKVLRELDETRDIPIIALTAAASERDKQLGLQAGFFRYLTKPLKVNELLDALEQVLSRAAGADASEPPA